MSTWPNIPKPDPHRYDQPQPNMLGVIAAARICAFIRAFAGERTAAA